MNRLDLQPDKNFVAEVKQLNTDVTDIKNAQRVGKDVLRPKIIEALSGGNPTVYDLTTNNNNLKGFRAIFQADHQLEPWATPLYKVTIGTVDGLPAPNDIAGFSYIDFENLGEGKIAYTGYFGANNFGDNRNVYLKVYFYATDTGVLTIEETF